MSENFFYLNNDFHNDARVKIFRRAPQGDTFIYLWISMISLASRFPNAGGILLVTDNVPYTPMFLSSELKIKLKTIETALMIFEKYKIIKLVKYKGLCAFKLLDLGIVYKFPITSRFIPEDISIEVFQRDGGKCVICGSNQELQYDHIFPHSKGGTSTVDNLRLLCKDCNSYKRDKIEEYDYVYD